MCHAPHVAVLVSLLHYEEAMTTEKMFQYLGEIYRDLGSIEFLMRCAVAQKENDLGGDFLQPPYENGKSYKQVPCAFRPRYFGRVLEMFLIHYPDMEDTVAGVLDLRNAVTHGLVAEVGHSGVTELVHLRGNKEGEGASIVYSLAFTEENLLFWRDRLQKLRRRIIHLAADK